MAQIQEELILYDKFTKTFTSYTKQVKQASDATHTAQDAVDKFTESQKTAGQATTGFTNTIRKLVGAYAGLQGLKKLVNLSDMYTQTTARLDMMNDGLQTTAELNDMIFQSAMRSRGAYQQTADMVAKLGTLAGGAFNSSAEIVAFAEQLNKQMTLSGTSSVGRDAAMLQLTQAMSSGVLRGEELNSVLEQTPMIAQSIANYMGVSIGEMRELASQGAITANVVKNAMFAAAEETNAKFAQMPMTWEQVWTQMQNVVTKALEPLLVAISRIANNIETLKPAFIGAAAAIGVFTLATWLANAANLALIATLLSNPLTWIALAIGMIVAAFYSWIQSIGGFKVFWLTFVDEILTSWDSFRILFMKGVYAVQNWLDKLGLKFKSIGTSIANFMGDMKVNVLTILENMVNGAIDIINGFIGKVNEIFDVSIPTIEKVTFAATAAVENEAAKAQRNDELLAAQKEVDKKIADREAKIKQMAVDAANEHTLRQIEIFTEKTASAEGKKGAGGTDSDTAGNIAQIANDTKAINKSVSFAQEDVKLIVDMAERRFVNNVNLTTQAPVINIRGANTGNTREDRRSIADAVRSILVEETASHSWQSYAVTN